MDSDADISDSDYWILKLIFNLRNVLLDHISSRKYCLNCGIVNGSESKKIGHSIGFDYF